LPELEDLAGAHALELRDVATFGTDIRIIASVRH
jgi:hypothetical protein